jgi:O-antigen/teichoic acid export membrane protein
MLTKISITFFSKLTNAILGFLNAILITQYLGAEGKGVTTLFITSVSLCLLCCQIIGGNSLVYLSSRLSASVLLFTSYIWAIVVSSTVSCILYFLGMCPSQYLVELIIVSILFTLFHAHLFIFLGKEKIILFNVLNPLPQLIQLLAGIVLFIVLQVHNVNTYIYNLYFIFALSYFISLIFILPKLGGFKMPDKKALQTIWKYGSNAQTSNILFFLNNRFMFYLLGYYFIKSEVGIYSIAVMVMEAVLLIGNSFSLMLYSKISNTSSATEQMLLTKKYAVISLVLTAFALCVVVLIPADMYTSVFGSDFYSIKRIVIYLLPGTLLMSTYYITSSYFSGTGKYHYNNYAVGSGLCISVVGGIIYISSGDIFTAAVITSTAFSAIALFSLGQFYKQLTLLR